LLKRSMSEGLIPFVVPNLDYSSSGWGPSSIPEQYKEVPYYAPYSKADKLGRVADLNQSGQGRNPRYRDRDAPTNALFSWTYEDDDSSFQTVDNTKVPGRRLYGRKNFQNRGFQQMKNIHQRSQQQSNQQRGGKSQGGKRQSLSRNAYNYRGRYADQMMGQAIRRREPSIEIKPEWTEIYVVEFSHLNKVSTEEPQPVDLTSAGEIVAYDKSFNSITLKNTKPLEGNKNTFYTVTTSEDPILKELSNEGNVFATDVILTHLMALSKSMYSWDVIVTKKDGNIFFDKRDNSSIDMLTVSETSFDAPIEDVNSINAPTPLSREATFINKAFSQQILNKGGEKKEMERKNPFSEGDDKVAPVGYKYRKWTLGDDITLVARCEVDGYSTLEGKEITLTIKALNEWEPKAGIEWRKKLEVQRGTVITTEFNNNSFKLAKWTIQSHLAGTDYIKIGFVSRNNVKDNTSHSILAIQDYSPREFASQTAINFKNAWAVVKNLIMFFQKQEDGKFVITRDLEKQAIRIHAITDQNQNLNDHSDEDEPEDRE